MERKMNCALEGAILDLLVTKRELGVKRGHEMLMSTLPAGPASTLSYLIIL